MKTLLFIPFILFLTACNNPNREVSGGKQTDTLTTVNKPDTTSSITKTDSSQTGFQHVKTITAFLNYDNLLDTLTLSTSSKDESAFNKITVSLAGFSTQNFIAKDYWTVVDSEFLTTNKNETTSNKVFIKKIKGQTALLLFGELDGAGYRGEFSIINITKNKAAMVFDHEQDSIDVEIPTTVTDLDNDGKLDFVFFSLPGAISTT